MLPDKLQHQQLVEIGIEQRADDRVEFPVVVMRAFCKIDDHRRRAARKDLREYREVICCTVAHCRDGTPRPFRRARSLAMAPGCRNEPIAVLESLYDERLLMESSLG